MQEKRVRARRLRERGLCESITADFPPFCLGPSVDVVDLAPDTTPWFGTLSISALSLLPAEPVPMQTHRQPVGFLIQLWVKST